MDGFFRILEKTSFPTNMHTTVIATPGRILSLVKTGTLKLEHLKHFVLEECRELVHDMRRDIEKIFSITCADTSCPQTISRSYDMITQKQKPFSDLLP